MVSQTFTSFKVFDLIQRSNPAGINMVCFKNAKNNAPVTQF